MGAAYAVSLHIGGEEAKRLYARNVPPVIDAECAQNSPAVNVGGVTCSLVWETYVGSVCGKLAGPTRTVAVTELFGMAASGQGKSQRCLGRTQFALGNHTFRAVTVTWL